MSFSSLPPELVRQIIESSVPSAYHSTTYGKGQSTLRSLCLTGRRFLPIAQPLLRETIELNTKHKIAMATTGAILGRWGDAVRHLVFRWTAGEAELGVNLEELASTFSNCVSLTISTELEGTKLAHMSHFRKLRSLHLSCPKLDLNGAQLSSLRDLTIVCNYNDLNLLSLLSPTLLPSLRHLALSKIDQSYLLILVRNKSFLRLLSQLDTLYVPDTALFGETLVLLKPSLSKTLVDFEGGTSTSYIRLSPHVWHIRSSNWITMLDVTAILSEPGPTPLRSYYLEGGFLQALSHEQRSRIEGYPEFISACQKHNVDIVYERHPFDTCIDPVLSVEFCRRQREARLRGQ